MSQSRSCSRNSRAEKPFAPAKDAEAQKNGKEGRNSMGRAIIPTDPRIESEPAAVAIEADEGEAGAPNNFEPVPTQDHADPESQNFNKDQCLFDYQQEPNSTVVQLEQLLEDEFASNNYWRLDDGLAVDTFPPDLV